MGWIPKVVYTYAFVFGALWLLGWEILALLDPGEDDTITEHVRPIIQSNSFWAFMLAGFSLWFLWHFYVEGERGLGRFFGW